jgi:hypothetical protein
MQAATITELWRNRDALLYNLTRVGERSLEVREAGIYAHYYKSCTVEKFAAEGKIWLAFSLNIVITSFRPLHITGLLSTNAEALIVTNSNDFIQVKTFIPVDEAALLSTVAGIAVRTNRNEHIQV